MGFDAKGHVYKVRLLARSCRKASLVVILGGVGVFPYVKLIDLRFARVAFLSTMRARHLRKPISPTLAAVTNRAG